MCLFHSKPNDTNWGIQYKYYINAGHKWGLHGVKCPVCGKTRCVIGVDYPTVDLSHLPKINRFSKRWPVNPEEQDDMRRLIIPMLPPNSYLPPGADFGPLVGKAWGKFGDFAWLNPWTMFMLRQTYEKLVSVGIQMPILGMPPEIKFRSKTYPDLVEPQIEPLARLVPASFDPPDSQPCPGCGRYSRHLVKMIVDGASVPFHVDLFRSRDHPTYILATERFKEAVEKFNMTDILFEEVEVQG
jgi:uncharacterized double-CXXCG motif protein